LPQIKKKELTKPGGESRGREFRSGIVPDAHRRVKMQRITYPLGELELDASGAPRLRRRSAKESG